MEIKTYEQRVLIADKNKWLFNKRLNIVSDEVYLGINANIKDWVEITEEEKLEIESKQQEETDIME